MTFLITLPEIPEKCYEQELSLYDQLFILRYIPTQYHSSAHNAEHVFPTSGFHA